MKCWILTKNNINSDWILIIMVKMLLYVLVLVHILYEVTGGILAHNFSFDRHM
jgi:hypothetical protein